VETKLDTEETRMLEQLTAIMAGLLLKLNGVVAINLYDVPALANERRTDPYEQRLLVVVSDEQFAEYKERLLNPAIIGRQDSDDKGNGWVDEAEETPYEAIFHLLGTSPESFFGHVDVKMIEAMGEAFGLDARNIIDVILVPESWTQHTASQLERGYTSTNQASNLAILPEREGYCALNEHRVFDPATGTFSQH